MAHRSASFSRMNLENVDFCNLYRNLLILSIYWSFRLSPARDAGGMVIR